MTHPTQLIPNKAAPIERAFPLRNLDIKKPTQQNFYTVLYKINLNPLIKPTVNSVLSLNILNNL